MDLNFNASAAIKILPHLPPGWQCDWFKLKVQVSTSCCVHLFDTTGAMRKTVSLLRTEKDFQSNLLRHQISLRRIFVLGDHKKRFLWSDFFREVKKCQVSFYRSFVTHASLCYHKTGMLFNTFFQYLYGLSCSLKVEELKKKRRTVISPWWGVIEVISVPLIQDFSLQVSKIKIFQWLYLGWQWQESRRQSSSSKIFIIVVAGLDDWKWNFTTPN